MGKPSSPTASEAVLVRPMGDDGGPEPDRSGDVSTETSSAVSTDIVVGVDGSTHAELALVWALDEAEVRGARVRAVMTWSFFGQGKSGLGMGTHEKDAAAALDAVVQRVAGSRAGLVDQVLVNDLAVDGLLDQANTAALLVVGSRGVGGVKGLLLGSTSRSLVERANVPVVIVPHAQRS